MVLAVLALIAFITNPIKKIRDSFEDLRNDLGSRIDDVAKEGRDAHAEIGKNIETATERLSRELGGQINGLRGQINGVQTTMGDVRQDMGRLQGTVEHINTK